MEAIKNLNEPTGSHRTTIANYLEVCILLLFLYLLRTRVIVCFMFFIQRPSPFIFSVMSNAISTLCLCLVSQRFYIPDRLSDVGSMFLVYKKQIRWHHATS